MIVELHNQPTTAMIAESARDGLIKHLTLCILYNFIESFYVKVNTFPYSFTYF